MKNMVKLFGLIAIVAVIGFSMTACEETKDPEEFEATTAGRLTITGLNDFEGSDIRGQNFSLNLMAGERGTNWYDPNEDTSDLGSVYSGTISGGQAVLKVFVNRDRRSGKSGGYQSYTGSDQNVEFFIASQSGLGGKTKVTVNFTNGIGSVDWSTATN